METAAFAGDDAGDLAAFDALDRLQRDGTLRAAVRVAVRSNEAPVDLIARADVVVDGPAGLAALLAELGESLRPSLP
jgi:trehalose 6-phosphate phosphatase